MLLLRRILAGIALLAVTAHALAAEAVAYQIQPGDVLLVSVWREPDLQRELLVRPDGGISYPLAGDVMAAGRSVEALQALIAERLSAVIPNPVVTVAVTQITGSKFYVLGKVNRPGEYPLSRPLDVLQALSLAGGMTAFAAADQIRVLRRSPSALEAIPFQYSDVESGKDLSKVVLLRPGDTVLVP
jgi:polysaccharide biosynthesis/export protein